MADKQKNASQLQNDLGEIRACGCGGVNLALGPMTLHFTSDDVQSLFELVFAAKQMSDASRRDAVRKRRGAKAKAHNTLH